MTKHHLLEELSKFNDDDEIAVGDEIAPYVPKIRKICGKTVYCTALYCDRAPEHPGRCFSTSKQLYFDPS